eukprot:3099279-Rhodomonas_salina.4
MPCAALTSDVRMCGSDVGDGVVGQEYDGEGLAQLRESAARVQGVSGAGMRVKAAGRGRRIQGSGLRV